MKFIIINRNIWSVRMAVLLSALFSIIVFLFLVFSLSPSNPEVSNTQSIDFFSVPARMYQLQVEAVTSGWTDSLHQEAAVLYTALGDTQSALSHWNTLPNSDNLDQRQLADIYRRHQQWSEYIELLRLMLAQSPEDPWVNYHLGIILASINPSQAEALLRRAGLSQEYSRVAADLLSVVINEPADPLISFRVGLVLAQHELWDYAEYAFNHAYIIGYPYAEASAYLALARVKQSKSGDAFIQFSLHLSAESAEIYYVYGLYLRHLLDYDTSLQAFHLAISYAPVNAAYAAELGTAYRLVIDYENAEYWLQRAVQLSNYATDYQRILATFYSQESTNLIPSEIEIVRDVRQALPNDPTLISGLGWALYSAGDVDSALAQFDSALSIQPGHVLSLYYKARVLASRGDLSEAIALMAQVAASDSDYAESAQEYLNTWQD